MQSPVAHGISLVPAEWVGLMPVPPTLTSEGLGWGHLSAFRFKYPSSNSLDLPPAGGHFVCVHMQNPCWLASRWNGSVRRSRSVPGDIIVMSAQQENSWEWMGEMDELQMFIDPTLLAVAGAEFSDRPVDLIEGICIRDAFVSAIAERLSEELAAPGGGTGAFGDAMAHMLVWHLLREHSTLRRRTEAERLDIPARKVRAAIDFMSTRLGENTSIADIAAAVEMTTFRFARGFKRATGHSPHRYLINRRIERARDLLRTSNHGLAEVASLVGFATQSHFTAAFRKQCGMTPGAYRRRIADS